MSKEEKKATKEKPEKRKSNESLDGYYPGLNGLNYAIGYLEQALAILSEPLLIGCSALAVVDFITGGGLLAIPFLSYLWASALAVAVTACFIVTWRKSFRAFSQNRYAIGLFLALLGLLLGTVDWTAVATQSLQQAMHMGFSQALTSLGFDPFIITNIRAGVAISMAVVVAISNHTAVTTAQAPKRRLAMWDNMLNKIAPVVTTDIKEEDKPGETKEPEAPVQEPIDPHSPTAFSEAVNRGVQAALKPEAPKKAPVSPVTPLPFTEVDTDRVEVIRPSVASQNANNGHTETGASILETLASGSNGHNNNGHAQFVPPYRRSPNQ